MHLFLSCVLLHLLQCLQFNAHEIYETIYKRALDFSSFKTHYIGVGVYTSVALLNHDCYPAITRYFRGKELVARAVRPLNPGNIVAENYGPIFTLRTLEDRQHSLMSRYWFTCACNACTQNWPKLVDMDEKDTNIRCQKKSCEGFIRVSNNKKGKSHCPNCGDTINATEAALLVKSYYSDYQQGLLLMKEGKFQEAMPLFSAFSDAMDQISCPPNKNVSLVQEALRQCWSYHHNKHVLDQ